MSSCYEGGLLDSGLSLTVPDGRLYGDVEDETCMEVNECSRRVDSCRWGVVDFSEMIKRTINKRHLNFNVPSWRRFEYWDAEETQKRLTEQKSFLTFCSVTMPDHIMTSRWSRLVSADCCRLMAYEVVFPVVITTRKIARYAMVSRMAA
jgi:hypothetical protein